MTPAAQSRLATLGAMVKNAASGMADMRQRFETMQGRHENGTAPRAVSAFNLFQTPEHVAARMAETALSFRVPVLRVLEPSAGLGRLYRALVAECPGVRIVMVEQSPDCCRELRGMIADDPGAVLHSADFLTMSPGELGGPFDAACMNPPFKMGADVRHIRHALSMLAPGGLLVGLCYDGTRQREHLRTLCETWEPLEPGTFREAGTDAAAVLLTIRKDK